MKTFWNVLLTVLRTPIVLCGVVMLPVYTLLVSCWVLLQLLRLVGTMPWRMLMTVVHNDNVFLTTHLAQEFMALTDNFGLLWGQLWNEEISLVRWWFNLPPDRPAPDATAKS